MNKQLIIIDQLVCVVNIIFVRCAATSVKPLEPKKEHHIVLYLKYLFPVRDSFCTANDGFMSKTRAAET